MKYDFKYVLENQDKGLEVLRDQDSIFEYQKNIKALNNQNKLIYQFKHSSAFKEFNRVEEFYPRLAEPRSQDDIWKKKNQLWMIPQEGNHQLEKQLRKKKPGTFTFEELKPYLKYLAWHLSVDVATNNPTLDLSNFPTRWGDNRFVVDHPDNEKRFNDLFTLVEGLHQKLELPRYKWEELDYNWHEFLGISWTCIQIGLGEIALWIMEPLFRLWEIEYKNGRNAISFVMGAIFQDCKLRILGTLTWIRAFAYKQVGNDKEYYNSLNRYVRFFERLSMEAKPHYNINNRVLEAIVLVYKHTPTPLNKERCMQLFHYTTTLFRDEPTECTRERGLICFDYIQTMFKKEYESYNFSRT
jgi:hypothetical protein